MNELPENTVRYLARRGYKAVPIARHDGVDLPPGTYIITPAKDDPAPDFKPFALITCDTQFPEEPE